MRVQEILAMSTYELNEHYCAADVDLGVSEGGRRDIADPSELQYIRSHFSELCTKAAYAIRSNHFIAFREVLLRGVIKQAVLRDFDRVLVSSIVSPCSSSRQNIAGSIMELLTTVVDLLFSSQSPDGRSAGFAGVSLGTDAPCPIVPCQYGVVPQPPTVFLVEAVISILNDVIMLIFSSPTSASSDVVASKLKEVFANLGLLELLLSIMEGVSCYWLTLSPLGDDNSDACTTSSNHQRKAIAKALYSLMESNSIDIPKYEIANNEKSDTYFKKDYDDASGNSSSDAAADGDRARPLLMRLVSLTRAAATLFITCLRSCRANKSKMCEVSSPKTTLHRVVRLIYNSMLAWDGTFMASANSSTASLPPFRRVKCVMSGDVFFQLQLCEILVRCRTHQKDVFSNALTLLSSNDGIDEGKSYYQFISAVGSNGLLPSKFTSTLLAVLGSQKKLPSDETLFIRLRGLLEELQISLNQCFFTNSIAAPSIFEVLRVDCSLTFQFRSSNSEVEDGNHVRGELYGDGYLSVNDKKASDVERTLHATIIPTPTTIFFSPLFFILLLDKNANDESNFVTVIHCCIRSLRASRDKSFTFRFINGVSVGTSSVHDGIPQRLFKRMIIAAASQLWREEMEQDNNDQRACFGHTGRCSTSPLLRFYEQMVKFGLNRKPFQRLFSVNEDESESCTRNILTKWTTPSPAELLKWFMIITNDFSSMLSEQTTLQLSSTSATITALTTSNIPSWIQGSKIASAPSSMEAYVSQDRSQEQHLVIKGPIVSDERSDSLSLTVCDKGHARAKKRSRSNTIGVHEVDRHPDDQQRSELQDNNHVHIGSESIERDSYRSRTTTDGTETLVNDMGALLAKALASSDKKCNSLGSVSTHSKKRSSVEQMKEEAIMVHHKTIQCLVDDFQAESRKRREQYQKNIESAIVRVTKKNEDFKSYVRDCVHNLNKELEIVESVGNTLVQDIEDIRTEYGMTLVVKDEAEGCHQNSIVLSPLSEEEALIHQQRTHTSNPSNRVKIECKAIESAALEAIKNKVEHRMAELGERYSRALDRFDPVRLLGTVIQ